MTVDIAAPALELAKRGWELNGLDPARHRTRATDVPALLAKAAKRGDRYDLVIADPPSFAPSQSAKARALTGYAALHCSALGLLAEGGYYLAASCSSHVTRPEFDETLRDGARRARRAAQILKRWGAPPDHPRLLSFPEGDYLKVTLARVW